MRQLLPLALLLPILVFVAEPTSAQTVTVTEVLVREVDRTGPALLTADPVELALARGAWTPPTADQPDPDGVVWQPLNADADGWLTGDALRHGYAYARLDAPADGVWLLAGMGYQRVYVNGVLREGNVYGHTDDWQPWQPRFDFAVIPVPLRAGANHLLFVGNRYGRLRARLEPASAPLLLNTRDVTLPDLVVGDDVSTRGAVVVMNATAEVQRDALLVATLAGDEPVATRVPTLAPHAVRKVGFAIVGHASSDPGPRDLHLRLASREAALDSATVALAVKQPHANRRVTFTSELDGSVQYYGLLPAREPANEPTAPPPALILSLHGAAVEALNQSGSYAPLSWAHVVAPTNRRPFGFNWEDWGRRDALEALDHAAAALGTAPDRVHLTGHSMGGHGAWHVGALHPDRFAAVAPSAGWVSFWSYRPDRTAGDASPLRAMLERATLPSRTLWFARNLAGLGVYVLHGADDQVVSVDEARTMRAHLAAFHRDLDWHEQPGAGHWWDLSDAPGADCVAWPPLLDFLARHRLPADAEVRHVAFATPSPAVSARRHWATITQQTRPFVTSTVDLRLDPLAGRLAGSTTNVARLAIEAAHVTADTLLIALDGDTLRTPRTDPVWLARDSRWRVSGPTDPAQKGAHRGGGFRAAFAHRVQLVYGTGGTEAENAWALARARFDAEHLWYQGNASLDVLPDTLYDPTAEPDRNVMLYGHAGMHAHWAALWPAADVQATRGEVVVGDRTLTGNDLGLLAVRPRPGSDVAIVGVVAGSGLAGLRLTTRRPYLAPGVAYPDVTVLADQGDGTVVRGAGFLGNGWTVAGGEFVWADGD